MLSLGLYAHEPTMLPIIRLLDFLVKVKVLLQSHLSCHKEYLLGRDKLCNMFVYICIIVGGICEGGYGSIQNIAIMGVVSKGISALGAIFQIW